MTPLPTVWSVADIAALYGRSQRWAERLVKSENFPRPLRGDSKRWWATQVIDFATSQPVVHSDIDVLTPTAEEKSATRIKRSAPVTRATSRNAQSRRLKAVAQ